MKSIQHVLNRGVWVSMLGLASIAYAAEPGTTMSVLSAKVDPLPVFASPGDANPTGSVPATGLPWVIKESRADFFKVNVGGRDVWVDALMVRASQKVSARCAAIQGAQVAAELGASSERCR